MVSWSGGKDSMATVILAHENNIPIDKIVFIEVMFDKKNNISGELPEHIDFVKNVAIPRFNEWGYKVEIIHGKQDYLGCFFHVITRSKDKGKNGKIVGFPLQGRCIVNQYCKINAIRSWKKQLGSKNYKEFVGIAKDEPKRLARLEGTNKESLLDKYGYTEEMAKNLCKENGLLSPLYKHTKRGGC